VTHTPCGLAGGSLQALLYVYPDYMYMATWSGSYPVVDWQVDAYKLSLANCETAPTEELVLICGNGALHAGMDLSTHLVPMATCMTKLGRFAFPCLLYSTIGMIDKPPAQDTPPREPPTSADAPLAECAAFANSERYMQICIAGFGHRLFA
jgi:hypothetical protein